MKRALAVVLVALVGVVAWAGPYPRATVNVVGSVTPATIAVTEDLILQCIGGIVWYRSLTADELAAGGLVSPGLGMTDGGAFGVLADFTATGDPVFIPRASGQVAIALLGTDAGTVAWGQTDGGTIIDAGRLPCFFSVP